MNTFDVTDEHARLAAQDQPTLDLDPHCPDIELVRLTTAEATGH